MLKKTHVFLPKIASVTLHIPKDFWWHCIFEPQQFSELKNFGPFGAGGGAQ